MRIRPAEEKDLAAAARLWFERLALLRESDANLILAPHAEDIWRGQARQWLDDPDMAFYVALAEDELAGLIIATIRANPAWLQPPRLGEILAMALDLHQARPGLGSALLKRAIAWLRARDIAALDVQASAYYPVEQAFWRAQAASLRSNRFRLKL